jgi:peptidyl-prolyl cis-trans isomerase B (cyclophilin B)
MTDRDPYEVLGLRPDADAAGVRAAYRELSKRLHPDVGGNAALFGLIREAYETLSDPAARASYDRSRGFTAAPPEGPSSAPPGPGPRPPQEPPQGPPNASPPPQQDAEDTAGPVLGLRRRRVAAAGVISFLVLLVLGVVYGSARDSGGTSPNPGAPLSQAVAATAAPASPTSTVASPDSVVSSVPCAYRSALSAARPVAVPPDQADPAALNAQVSLQLNVGDVTLTLSPNAPCTGTSFVHLVKARYYDFTPCHRLTTQGIYVLQCGDPTGKGTGGPGYAFDDENLTGATYPRGTLAMANSGPDTNGSQFFLVYRDTQLAPSYTPFGTVTAGLDVLDRIAQAGSTPVGDGHPNLSVTIDRATTTN